MFFQFSPHLQKATSTYPATGPLKIPDLKGLDEPPGPVHRHDRDRSGSFECLSPLCVGRHQQRTPVMIMASMSAQYLVNGAEQRGLEMILAPQIPLV